MSRLSLGLVAALLLLVFLLATAPARLLLAVLPEGQLQMQGVSGTLWRGSASRALVQSNAGLFQLGKVDWRLHPLSLLTFSPRLQLDSQWGQQYLRGTAVMRGSEDVDLMDVDARLPASLVRQLIPLELAGVFTLQAPELSVRDGLPVEAEGRLVWQQGGWVAPGGARPLGDYALDFSQASGGVLLGEVITLAGDLLAEGSVTLQGHDYSVNISLSGPGLEDQQLQQALQLVAVPEGDAFRVKLNGALQ